MTVTSRCNDILSKHSWFGNPDIHFDLDHTNRHGVESALALAEEAWGWNRPFARVGGHCHRNISAEGLPRLFGRDQRRPYLRLFPNDFGH
jgi:hypothetical protein